MAKEEIGHGIRVNIAAPGLVVTDMGAKLVQAKLGVEDMTELDAAQPLGRVVRPADVARVVRFLVSAGRRLRHRPADRRRRRRRRLADRRSHGRGVRARVSHFESESFAAFLGFRWDDESTIRLTVRPELLNSVGTPARPRRLRDGRLRHGRRRCSARCSRASRWRPRASRSTSWRRRDTGDVVCTTRVDRRGRRAAFLTSELRHESGKLLATAIGTFAILTARPR